jgi:hypothetical protein
VGQMIQDVIRDVKNKKESFFIALFNSWKCSHFIRIVCITHHHKEEICHLRPQDFSFYCLLSVEKVKKARYRERVCVVDEGG